MRRFEYMLWLLVAVFCLMPCGVSAAETQKDLKIKEVFQRYGKNVMSRWWSCLTRCWKRMA